MEDILEKIGNSLIQHGKLNDRVYIMKLNSEDFEKVIKRTEILCKENSYSKIFAKVPKKFAENLLKKEYIKEAEIPNFYNEKEDCIFFAKYFNEERKKSSDVDKIKKIFNIIENKEVVSKLPDLDKKYTIKDLNENNAEEMAELYKKSFESYPFPIFEKEYLKNTMKENIIYAGIFESEKLVSIASAETYKEYLNAEMTDFATLEGYGGQNFSLILLNYLEKKMKKRGYKILYTIARVNSIPMNITFKKLNYKFAGMLINNTNISGSIENMNVWYKEI